MKNCSYCGRENNDAAVGCFECGTKLESAPPPEADPRLQDPALSLVSVGTFDNVFDASMVRARLESAGIAACVPEEYTPNLFLSALPSPLECATVRVLARDYDAAIQLLSVASEPETKAPDPPADQRARRARILAEVMFESQNSFGSLPILMQGVLQERMEFPPETFEWCQKWETKAIAWANALHNNRKFLSEKHYALDDLDQIRADLAGMLEAAAQARNELELFLAPETLPSADQAESQPLHSPAGQPTQSPDVWDMAHHARRFLRRLGELQKTMHDPKFRRIWDER